MPQLPTLLGIPMEEGNISCELQSKLLVSLLMTPIVVPYVIPYITPLKEFRLWLMQGLGFEA